MLLVWLMGILIAIGSPAHATTYYMSPTGSNSNDGLSSGGAWLTFAHALANTLCGDTLLLLNGTYGDGTSTGKPTVTKTCTQGSPFTIGALNSRKARIFDSGNGRGLYVLNSQWIIIDGIYGRSQDTGTAGSLGVPLFIKNSTNITLRNAIAVNPNRFHNSHAISVQNSEDVLLEDNEAYIFSRHCVELWQSKRVVVRRQYCNPRDGMPSGGVGPGLGRADAVTSMYPCQDCISENSIADGTQGGMFLAELNATYGSGVLMHGSKILGGICYLCNTGNGVYLNARTSPDLNHAPVNNIVQNNAFIDFLSPSTAIRISNGQNNQILNNTCLTASSTGRCVSADDADSSSGPVGADPSNNSVYIHSNYAEGFGGFGFIVSGHGTWAGTYNRAFDNSTNYSPSLPSNWGAGLAASTVQDAAFGACKGVWVPDASPLKGAGPGGSDVGANILYRYVDGVLTTTPLWDPTTGEFPHGEADLDGVNRVAGQSLFDFHARLNVNTGGCPFPASYTGGGGPVNPGEYYSSTDLDGAHTRTISSASNRGLTVFAAAVWDSAGSPTHVTSITSSCGGGESIPALTASPILTGTTAGHRSLMVFGKINPALGNCTLTPTLSGSLSGGWVLTSVEETNIASYGTVSSATGSSATPSVTSLANADEVIRDALATSNVPTISVGANQSLKSDTLHASEVLRLASSEKAGSSGQIMSYTMGSLRAWALAAVPIIPPSAGGGSGSTFTVSKYRIDTLHGTAGNPEVTLGALAPQNTPAQIGATGEFRLRIEVLVSVAASQPTGVAPYCKKVGGSFERVMNALGSRYVRFYGAGAEPTIPASFTLTTQRFTGTFVQGETGRTETAVLILPNMPAGTRTEIEYQLSAGNLVAGDTIECELRRDDGATLGTHTQPMQISIVGPRASMGF